MQAFCVPRFNRQNPAGTLLPAVFFAQKLVFGLRYCASMPFVPHSRRQEASQSYLGFLILFTILTERPISVGNIRLTVSMKLNEIKFRMSIVVTTVVLCVAWGVAVWVFESDQYANLTQTLTDKEALHAKTRGETISADIQRSLRVMSGIPEVMGSWTELINVVQQGNRLADSGPRKTSARQQFINAADVTKLNHLLALAKVDFSADIVWVLNANGDCVASSNFATPTSFIGINFKERNYYSIAMNGDNASQFAVGKITHEPGLYFSSPVFSAQNVIGVVAVKVDIARLTHHIDLSNVLIADENGVVVLAEDAAFAMKAVPGAAVKDMPSAKRRQIYLRDQFESIDIQPWPGYARLSRVGNAKMPYLVNVTSVDNDAIKIYVLADARPILQMQREFLRIFFLITLCGCALIVIGAGMVWYSHTRNQTSRLLQRQHDELDQAQHLAKIGSWSYDYETRLAQCSKEYRVNFLMQNFDTEKSPPTVRQTLEFVHPDDRERIKAAYIEGIGQGRGYSAEYRLVRRDGEVRYVKANAVIEKDGTGKPVKITGTCRDITDEHRALLALEDSERHLRRVLNSSLIGIIQGDDTGRILDMNQAFMCLTGYAVDDLESGRLTWHSMASAGFQQLDAPNIFGLNGTPTPFEMDLRTATGKELQVLIGMAKVEDARSEWVCFVLDLSERNRVNRIQSEFISVVSHELRTPLTSIRGSLSLLESGMLDGNQEKKAELIRIAHRNSQRLIGIVNDILDMEKLTAGKMVFDMQKVNMTEVIAQAVEFNTGFAQQFNVKFVAHAFPEQAYIRCDSGRLMQVITNLMSNAAKFSPEGGVVDLHLAKSGELWRFDICDHGPGIAEEFRSRIFGAFSQAEDANTRQKGGTGLGLNITKIMVEQMGGNIGFESVPGQGATFWISFAAQH